METQEQNEKPLLITQGTIEENGRILQKDILFMRDNRIYSVEVAIPEYAEYIAKRNSKTTDPDLIYHANFLIINELQNLEELVRTLQYSPIQSIMQYLEDVTDIYQEEIVSIPHKTTVI